MATVKICDLCDKKIGNPVEKTESILNFFSVRTPDMPAGTSAHVEISLEISAGNRVLKDVCSDCIRGIVKQAISLPSKATPVDGYSHRDELRIPDAATVSDQRRRIEP